MVALGGTVRLTGSGLSMVEWHPLMGTVPPLNATAWEAVFAEYQRSPQFQQVNHWMTLDDFQRIFMWEYLHRLLGRLLGIAFLLPWLYFLVRGQLTGPLDPRFHRSRTLPKLPKATRRKPVGLGRGPGFVGLRSLVRVYCLCTR